MIIQTRGIVLNIIKYGESSSIVKILTEDLGLVSLMIRKSKSKRSNNSSKIYFKLALLDLVFNFKENKSIQNAKEASVDYHYTSLNTNIIKSSILLFLNELLYKTIKEEETNKPLFEFIYNSLVDFDKLEKGIANFHIFFLCHFTRLLGVPPQNNYSESENFFSIQEARFQNFEAKDPYKLDGELSLIIHRIINSDIKDLENIQLTAYKRKILLKYLIDYYRIHHDNSLNLKSHQILEQVFS